jgi:hypothetical protein
MTSFKCGPPTNDPGPERFIRDDGVSVPLIPEDEPQTSDSHELAAWLAAGNVPDPYVAPEPRAPATLMDSLAALTGLSPEEIAAEIKAIAAS